MDVMRNGQAFVFLGSGRGPPSPLRGGVGGGGNPKERCCFLGLRVELA